MPLEVIETTDPIAGLIRFETSAVYEMIISLSMLLNPTRREWVTEARAALPPDLFRELEAVYAPYSKGYLFLELAVDYPDHHDVPGFIRYVRDMAPEHFIFYLVGRIVPVDAIAATGLDPAALFQVLESAPYDLCLCSDVPFDDILADVPAFQARLAALWERYWREFFSHQIADLRGQWEQGLQDKQALLVRLGGQGLYEYVTGKTELLPPLPPDQPVQEIVFTPLYFAPAPVYMFYGYGNITVLFDSERTEARVAQIERNRERALGILKALGDGSRLEILRLVAQHERQLNGKKIAAKLNLSASAVSRHLSQLKDAGVIIEEMGDNRTITYRLQRDPLTELPELVLEYLYQ